MFLQTILVNKINDTKSFLKYIIKTKTIDYDHLRQCLREAHLSSQINNNILFRYGNIPESQFSAP